MALSRRRRRRRPSDDRRTWGQRVILLFNSGLIAVSLIVAGLLDFAGDRAAAVNRVALDRSLTERPKGDPGSRVINILLVGSDSSANLAADDPIQVGRQGERLGDVIIIAHLDERTGDIALLSLPRDLWVPLAGTKRDDRINRAFLVGGAATLIDTIEEAFDIPIHHYINVDFAGFQSLVESVGEVEVYFDTPARDWNVNAKPKPRSQTGFAVATAGCHSLDPDQALAYVRSRYYQTQEIDGTWVTDRTSDLGRIRRQQDFLERLLSRAIERGARNPLVLADLIDAGIQNVAIDQELTPSILIDLSATFRGFEPSELQTYTFPVTDGTIGANRVLIPRVDDAVPVLELFGGEAFDDADTVGLELVYDPGLTDEGDDDRDSDDDPDGDSDGGADGPPSIVVDIASRLDDAGFDFAEPREARTEAGLVVRHSADGRQAAELVAVALAGGDSDSSPFSGSEVVFEQTTGLSGRSIVVAIGPGSAAPTVRTEADHADVAAPSADSDPGASSQQVAGGVAEEGGELAIGQGSVLSRAGQGSPEAAWSDDHGGTCG